MNRRTGRLVTWLFVVAVLLLLVCSCAVHVRFSSRPTGTFHFDLLTDCLMITYHVDCGMQLRTVTRGGYWLPLALRRPAATGGCPPARVIILVITGDCWGRGRRRVCRRRRCRTSLRLR
jgi:hypothetical protein